ncbi:MAG: molybdopterin synthase sulfur carrier subunit [Candidatus Sericytochromatia bacterium]|nr:MAG: molybdopterin synthase sulfur carrier subunit [Candidatus Sericytochromatia bacterium]
MKKITLKYFAKLKDDIGKSSETLEIEAKTLSDVYDFISNKYSLSLSKEFLKVALNDEFSDWDTEIEDSDTIVFIPPVAGG